VDVAFATFAALAEDELFTDFGEVDDGFENDVDFAGFGVFFLNPAADEGAGWDFVDDVRGGLAEALIATAWVAVGGVEFGVEEEGFEAVGAVVDVEDDAAAASAVAAVGSAFGLEFAAVEVDGAVSAFTGVGVNFDVVDEHGEWARF
jgi:hypothetical protein